MRHRSKTKNERYNKLLEKQGFGCAGCGSKIGDKTGKRLSEDHNHTTGKQRGLLCYKCNVSLGLLNDDVDTLTNLIYYLWEHDGPKQEVCPTCEGKHPEYCSRCMGKGK